MNVPLTTACAALLLLNACSSKPPAGQSPHETVTYIQVTNPQWELCTDDTLHPTDWINVPVARFGNDGFVLNGRVASEQGLRDWADSYYANKAERGLWVEISSGKQAEAEHALLPLVRKYPDLQLRQVPFDFACAKTQK